MSVGSGSRKKGFFCRPGNISPKFVVINYNTWQSLSLSSCFGMDFFSLIFHDRNTSMFYQ